MPAPTMAPMPMAVTDQIFIEPEFFMAEHPLCPVRRCLASLRCRGQSVQCAAIARHSAASEIT
jgi:hypothetical protein